jgi:ornithine cyclodeaminase
VLHEQAARLDAHDLGVVGHQHQRLRRALDGTARQRCSAFGFGALGGGACLLGRKALQLELGFQRSDPFAFSPLGGFALKPRRQAYGLGTLGRQPLVFGTPFSLALRLGPGFGVACGLLRGQARGGALDFRGGDALALGSFDRLALNLGRDALCLLQFLRPALFFGTTVGQTLRLGPGLRLAFGLLGGEASSLMLGSLGGSKFTFCAFGGLAPAFCRDALLLLLLGHPAFVFCAEFGLALQFGPRGGVAPSLLVDPQRVSAAAKDLPADQQAQPRSDQQPKEVFAHEWNIRRKRCDEHRCESAATTRGRWRHANKFLELVACFMHRAASPCGSGATHVAMLRHGPAFHFGTTVALAGHGPSAMQVIDAPATRDALPFARLVPALHRAFAEGCEVPPRQAHAIGQADGIGCTSLIMPAWSRPRSARPHYGVKIVNIAPGNAARGLPGLHASYLLFDALTGVPLACIDGGVLTTRRTAAASALAASFLARSDARRLLVVGAGAVARVLPEAYRAVRPIEHVAVWARAPDKAAALADALRADGFDAAAEVDLAAAVAQSDIVSCATLATEPLVHGRWLAPGSHLDLIGSFTPQMREADDDCFAGARLFVDTDEALRKSGDLLGPLSRGVLDAARRYGTLDDLCSGSLPGRQGPLERTVFKSVGTALEDLAAAVLMLEDGQRR